MIGDDNINNLRQVKKNLMFYYSLADKAYQTGDHNTAILIKAALDNAAVKRLNVKL